MVPGQPEHYGDVILFLQPGEREGDLPTLGLWGARRTVEMPYGTLQTALCRPREIGIEGFEHLFSGDPLPMARGIAPEDVERLRAALRAWAAARGG
ncbi:MAG TPA: hypothetical protein VFE37_28360 [Chloroflexota bacterium]|nr:hypothetical protein [Chloroflexota bacterium]